MKVWLGGVCQILTARITMMASSIPQNAHSATADRISAFPNGGRDEGVRRDAAVAELREDLCCLVSRENADVSLDAIDAMDDETYR